MDITVNKIGAGALSIPDSASNQQVDQTAAKQETFERQGDISSDVQLANETYIEEMTEKIQQYLDNRNINIAFSTYGSKNEKISVTVTEKETGKVIREIPAEELQRLSARMDELMGMIFNDQA
jgi:flagellar protein FlaG